MAENKKEEAIVVVPQYDLNAKWDACLDLGIRRFVYYSAIGAFTGLLLFRTPTTRWAATTLGAGFGVGSAYTECSLLFAGKSTPIPKIYPSDQYVHLQLWYSFLYALSICLFSRICRKWGRAEEVPMESLL